VFDLHCDMLSKSLAIFRRGLAITPENLIEGGVKIQTFAVFSFPDRGSYKTALKEIAMFQRMLARNREIMEYIIDSGKIDKKKEQSKIYCLLAVEGGHIFRDIDDVRFFAKMGIFYITINRLLCHRKALRKYRYHY